MRFEVLGPLRVWRGSDIVPVRGRLRQGLLALLLARRDAAVPADWLTAALWDSNTPGGSKLQVLVHHVRRLLDDPDQLVFESGGYRLRVPAEDVDAGAFDELVARARDAADPARRAELLRRGLALWRGRPYQDLDLAGLAGEAARLSEQRLLARESLMEAELACGRHAAVVSELGALVARHPLRERLYTLHMSALYQGGRQAEALAVYQRARRTLVDELGLEPGAEMRELERRILAGDPVHPAQPPAQLPHDVPVFVGRDDELAELDRCAAAPGTPVVAIAGTAAVGKTSLVTHWAHRARGRFPDGQLHVDLRGYGPDQPLPPADALAGFLRALGEPDAAIPGETTERAARFRTLLDRKRVLVVLDNAPSVAAVRPLLPGTPTCFVVVTSRDALAGLSARDGAHRIALGRLTTGESRTLLRELLGDRLDTETTTRLIDRCAGLPLALRIAAERVGDTHHDTLSDFADEPADQRDLLDLLDSGDPHASVRAVFEWSYQRLDPAAARLFRLCGLRPGHDIDLYALAALTGTDDVRATRREVETLVRAHLVEATGQGRYRQHDLLWAYALELAAGEDSAPAVGRLLDHYRYAASVAVDTLYPDGAEARPRIPAPHTAVPDLAGRRAAMAWLSANHANLLAAATYAGDHGWPEHTGDLSATLARHIRRRGLHVEAFRMHSLALASARELGERSHEQTALAGLGHVLRMTGRYAEATEHYRSALDIARDLGDRHGELSALGGLGDTCFTAGDHRGATDHYGAMLRVAQDVGYRLGELKALAGFGHACMWAARYVEGEDYYRRAHAIALELGNRASELTALLGLGYVHLVTGRYEQATDFFRRGLAIAREVGHSLAAQAALAELANIHVRLGAHEPAAAGYEEALAITRIIGVRSNEALVSAALGNLHRVTGRYPEAAEHLERAHAIATESGHHIGTATALDGLGRLHCATGDPSRALQCHQDALTVAEKLDLPRERVLAHDGLGQAYLALGQREQARGHWAQALALATELGIPEAVDVAARLDGQPARRPDVQTN